ncbi:MAG: family 16 glycosylhydrolase [Armatimonadetes bacterium]|nr:family 16 glycosylhydrolase [Armatimonadota bacterium]
MLTSLLLSAFLPHLEAKIAPKWTLTFDQEFDGPKGQVPDPKVWSRDLGGGGYGNGEWQSYTDGNKNAFLDGDGNLVIEARKEPTKGDDGIQRDYSSARLKTNASFTQKYGKFEARMKMPVGKGMWPAFWMLGDNAGSVGWPRCGEIDIMEYLGHQTSLTHGTIHGPGYSGGGGVSNSLDTKLPLDQDFHVYGMEWEPEEIRFTFDGKQFAKVTPNDIGVNDWAYDHPFFIILNLAVGGGWPGYPDASTKFPQRFVIDYVRAYKDENLKVDEAGIRQRDDYRKAHGPKYEWPGPFKIPGTINAIDFNLGGEGKGYHDADPENQGGAYRPREGVDIGASGTTPKDNVGWTKAGEWLAYDLNVEQGGTFKIEATVASEGDGGEFHLEVDGQPIGDSVVVPKTGGWTTWKTISLGDARLYAGKHTLKVRMDKNGATGSIGNLLSIRFFR